MPDREEKDKDLEKYFASKKKEPIPQKILDGYTQEVMIRLQRRPSPWLILGLPALGLAAVAAIALAIWQPWKVQEITRKTPSPVLAASPAAMGDIVQNVEVLEEIGSVEDIIPTSPEDILPHMELLDSFVIAMNVNAEPTPSLSADQEAEVLMQVDDPAILSEDSPDDVLDSADDLTIEEATQQAGNKGQQHFGNVVA